MWQEFFRFDLRYQLRQPLLWLMTVPLMAGAFLTAGSPTFRLGGGIGNVHLNAPAVIANQLGVLSMLAMFLVAVFIAGAVLRDSDAGIADLLYATPMRKRDYLGGRFLAGLAACLLVFVLVVLAMMLGSLTSAADPERLNPVTPLPYLWSFAVFIVPNVLFVAALLMLLAVAGRSMLLVYVGVLAFFVLWAASGLLAGRPALAMAAALLDPFGVRALALATRYFTSAEMNTALPPLAGLLLANRLLWSVLSLALLAATIWLFKPQRAGAARGWFRRAARAQPAPVATAAAAPVLRPVTPRFGMATAWRQFWHVLRFDTMGVLKSVPFLVMLLLALANFIANVSVGGLRFDSVPYPLTRLMLVELADSLNFVLAIVVMFYSGELVWRDRQAKIADLTDALPVPGWLPLLAKCGALTAVVAVFLGAGVLAALAVQLVQGGVRPEPLLYLQGTLMNGAWFVLMALAMLALQVVVNQKYVAYALSLLLVMLKPLLAALGFEHPLYRFASLPELVYSDLNGYGGLVAGWLWFALYWTLGTLALLLVAQAFRPSGRAARWRVRWPQGVRRLRGASGWALALSLAGFAASGGWIAYNMHVLNRYQSGAQLLDARADHERRYRQYLALPQPGITSIAANVDLYPAQRSAAIRGRYRLKNRGATPLRTLYLQMDTAAQTTWQALPAHRVLVDDERHGVRIIELAQALAPGATLDLAFLVNVRQQGFTASGQPEGVQHNGSYFTIEQYFPHLGYNAAQDITDTGERRQRGLGAPHGMPKLDDLQARYSNYWKQWGIDGDLVDFQTTISTSADQVALAPGTLERSWEKDGRRYFSYRMAQPALPFFAFQSGRWQVQRAQWQDVAIEVHHDAKHAWNTGSMIAGAQQALAYNTAHFGPYPHRHLRIAEFPLYQQYARSFPGLIPFSESLGFISDLRDPDGVDHVFYVTAHEVAHQWWGDQLIAANVQGSGMLTESLAEYSALMAVEKQFGADKVRRILRFDLDAYLAGRGREQGRELPLFRSEGQAYIEYRKGSLAFYRLRAEIGEAALNRALKAFLAQHRYRSAPYATSRDLLSFIRAETPAAQQQLLTDLFERVVLYDNRLAGASALRRADGRWDVTLQVQLAKLEADGKGRDAPRAYDEPVDLAVYAEGTPQRLLYRGKHRLPGGAASVTVTVDAPPGEAVLDPEQLLIERNGLDNRRRVQLTGG
ncbi:ABC-type transport system involved in multi-copper enzyme maturation, permease component [Janthinobacterium lividum]|uniref:ABC transporter permease/M1 family aminopeptidase n=1 Tax=Janthinobacterium lividum TaxID=29581 RepID=UPI000DFAD80F|nr:M1 family aminopeptidase [Janthinobacterium lividum]STR18336.1 ABC-type transport system involved in multi-copper enzyme maturation, permease component [Janthinobacterium lividum]